MKLVAARGAIPVLSLALVGTVGCAFEPGEPYGLVTASLDVHYRELADRYTPDGFQKLNTDYQARLTSAVLVVDAIELLDAGTELAVATFDPANPPPGYSLCHGGHCHAADGSLVDYEDIAAELAGAGGTEPTTVVTLTAGTVDLLTSEPFELGCAPSCALPEGYLVLARLTASRLELAGQVRDARVEPRIAGEVDWQVALELLQPAETSDANDHEHDHDAADEPAGRFELRLDLPVNEDEPPNVTMRFAMPTDAKLLDRVDFSLVPPDSYGVIDLNASAGAAARSELALNFAALGVDVAVTRADE